MPFEKFLKDNIEMFKGDAKSLLEIYPGNIYNKGLYSIKKYPNVGVLTALQIEICEKIIFKNGLGL